MNKTLLKKLTVSVSVISMLIAVDSYAGKNPKLDKFSKQKDKKFKKDTTSNIGNSNIGSSNLDTSSNNNIVIIPDDNGDDEESGIIQWISGFAKGNLDKNQFKTLKEGTKEIVELGEKIEKDKKNNPDVKINVKELHEKITNVLNQVKINDDQKKTIAEELNRVKTQEMSDFDQAIITGIKNSLSIQGNNELDEVRRIYAEKEKEQKEIDEFRKNKKVVDNAFVKKKVADKVPLLNNVQFMNEDSNKNDKLSEDDPDDESGDSGDEEVVNNNNEDNFAGETGGLFDYSDDDEIRAEEIKIEIEEVMLGKREATPQRKAKLKKGVEQMLQLIKNSDKSKEGIAEELREGFKFSKEFAEAGLDDKVIAGKTEAERELFVLALMQNTDPEVHKDNADNAATTIVGYKKILEQADKIIAGTIGGRINEVSIPNIVGVGAGDDDRSILHGVWGKALYANNIQKKHGTTSGYRGRVVGGTVGVDFAITDDLMAGLAYSNLDSRFKYKDALEGNKLNAKTHVVSIYGSQKLNDKFTLQGAVAAGISRVKTERLNNAGGIIRPVSAKYNHRSFSANAFVSYNYDTGKGVAVIPSAGVRYNHHINGAFTESGVGVNNIKAEKDTHDTVFGVVGTRILTKYKVSKQWSLIPSLNLSAEYLFNNKAPKIKSRFEYMDKYFDTDVSDHKLDKIRYNVGASLLAKTRNIEVTAGYNLHLRKKYQGHQASIKLNYLF